MLEVILDASGRYGGLIPSAFAELSAGEEETAFASGSGRGRILVVDDGPENLRVLSELLRNEGYVTRPVSDAPLALEVAAAEPPDLILLDIMMPGMDGFEVCRRLKQNARLRDIPIVFLSAMDDVADKVKAFSVGASRAGCASRPP